MPALLVLLLLVLLSPASSLQAQGTLDIYWVDAEGGASTLIVTPSGESLLVDTANPRPEGRDVQRILDTAKMAGVERLDYVLTTHYHGDHYGSLAPLSKAIPVGTFLDHGDTVEADRERARPLYEAYLAAIEGKRRSLKAGEKIPLKGLDVTVVASAGESIANPINGGGPNPLCGDAKPIDPDRDPENNQSLGFLLQFGDFSFLNLGDLTWNYELPLACPVNKVGKVTVFQATHHGFFGQRSGLPAHVWAVDPQVLVINNGPRKGINPPEVYEMIQKIPRLEDVWQGHIAEQNDSAHNTNEQMIANLTPSAECEGHWIKLSAKADGTFTLTNGRNNFSKTYKAL